MKENQQHAYRLFAVIRMEMVVHASSEEDAERLATESMYAEIVKATEDEGADDKFAYAVMVTEVDGQSTMGQIATSEVSRAAASGELVSGIVKIPAADLAQLEQVRDMVAHRLVGDFMDQLNVELVEADAHGVIFAASGQPPKPLPPGVL